VHAIGVDLGLMICEKPQKNLHRFTNPTTAKNSCTSPAPTHCNCRLLMRVSTKWFARKCWNIFRITTARLLEIARILKPGGVAAISVPRYVPEWICWALSDEYHSNEGGHLRIFKEHQLQREIENTGLCFIRRHWAHALHSVYWWLQCAFWESKHTNPLVQNWHKLLVWDMMEQPSAHHHSGKNTESINWEKCSDVFLQTQ
jgi:hypothetical protein